MNSLFFLLILLSISNLSLSILTLFILLYYLKKKKHRYLGKYLVNIVYLNMKYVFVFVCSFSFSLSFFFLWFEMTIWHCVWSNSAYSWQRFSSDLFGNLPFLSILCVDTQLSCHYCYPPYCRILIIILQLNFAIEKTTKII